MNNQIQNPEILFRAKTVEAKNIEGGVWVEGQYIQDVSRRNSESFGEFAHKIQPLHYEQAFAYPIDLTTLCQHLMLNDANEQKIYRGDILGLEITEELMKTSFSNSNLGKAVNERGVTRVLLYFKHDTKHINARYEIYFEIDGKLTSDEDGDVNVEAIGDDMNFPIYFITKGAIVVGNIFDNPELLKAGESNE